MKDFKLVMISPSDYVDERNDFEILDEINRESASLNYLSHRTIQEDLCELERRLKALRKAQKEQED